MANQFRVYIEDMQGRVMQVDAITASIDVEYLGGYGYGGPIHSTVTLEALNDLSWMMRGDWDKTIKKKRSGVEWECSFCHRPNQRADETCKSCGAVRSFIYKD